MSFSTNKPSGNPSAKPVKKSNRGRKQKVIAVKARASAKRVSKSRSGRGVSTRVRAFRCKQVYHLFQRGNYKRKVFVSDEERAAYLNYFFSRARLYHVRVHHFCLMSNHVHFVLEQTRKKAISRLMRDLQGLHTRKQNSRLGEIGNLWNQHYGCRHVDSDRYYRALMWYVSNNPVQVGDCKDPSEYKWSGAMALANGGDWLLRVRTEKGSMQPVPIRLWMERFQHVCASFSWHQVQGSPLSVELEDQIKDIELILDGTARLHLANQIRVRRLNTLRMAERLGRGKAGRPGKRNDKKPVQVAQAASAMNNEPTKKNSSRE